MKEKAGFTIIELMIVIAIFGILSAIAIPNYFAYRPQHRAKGAARQLYSDLYYAKMQSAAKNLAYFVSLDAVNDRYTVYKDNGNGTFLVTEEDLFKTVNIKDSFAGTGIISASTRIDFFPDGSAGSTVTNTVSIRPKIDGNDDRQRNVVVNSATGRVEIVIP